MPAHAPKHPLERFILGALFIVLTTGCILTRQGPSEDLESLEEDVRARFEPLELEEMPSSPTNQHADSPAAAALGRRLFSDPGLSADGTISCERCHAARDGFAGSTATSPGVFNRQGTRHAPSVQNIGWQRFTLWDGRADSAWSQALKAIEADAEMDFTRLEVAHYIAQRYAEDYERSFGPLPSLEGLPQRGRPGLTSWEQLTAQQRQDVERVFSNVGKALEAHQRRINCTDTPLDQLLRGDSGGLSEQALRGAIAFDEAGCTACHSGPLLSDQGFHNLGIGSANDQDAQGRAAAYAMLRADVFNGQGRYSDDVAFGRQQLELMAQEDQARSLGAFKTPSLRGVAQRRRFMHNGSFGSLREVLGFYSDAPNGPSQRGSLGVHDPDFLAINLDPDARQGILDFLTEALICP